MPKPRQKKYLSKKIEGEPTLKLRPCLGHDCEQKIHARYPGLCEKCKSRQGEAWASPVVEYDLRAATAKIREGFNR